MKQNLRTVAFAMGVCLLCGSTGIAFAAGKGAVPADYGAAKGEHFHPKGKMPSEHAINILEALRKMLPFSDTRDFDEEKKRFIAAPNSWLRQ